MSLARQGVGESARGKFYGGDALSWSGLDSHERRRRTIDSVIKFLRGRGGRPVPKLEDTIVLTIQGEQVAFRLRLYSRLNERGGAAKLVGQPFLSDYQIAKNFHPVSPGLFISLLARKL